MTRPSRILAILSLLVLTSTGCSTLSGGRSALGDRWRTMASNGGSALPTETGPPDARIAAELGEPETPLRSEGKISGRVLDSRGRPVPNAEVRLADGTSRVGRDLRATTDDSGGFTIRGLRPGSSYMLIAERDNGRDALVGRASARAPSGNVRIRLTQDDSEVGKRTAEADDPEEAAPDRRVGRVSSRRDVDEEDADPFESKSPRAKVNEADLPPAEEVEPSDPFAPDDPTPAPAPPRNAKAGWRRQASESGSGSSLDRASTATKPTELATSEKPAPKTFEEEGPNPLPPAKEKPVEPLNPPAVEPAAKPDPVEPAPAAPVESPTPTAAPEPAAETLVPPAMTPTPDPMRSPDAPPSSLPVDSVSIPAEVAPKRRATWGDLAMAADAPRIPPGSTMPLSRRRLPEREAEAASAALQADRLAASKRTRFGLAGSKGRQTPIGESPASVVAASCQFDTKKGRIVDFTLPDLDGNATKFSELDSDYVLIDFWGSWCKPCIESIPHLVELQSRYGPKTLRVVGGAYEQEGSAAEKVQRVDKVARSLNVNYPLLLSEADGKTCPLQQALNIQKYPTMVLVDRTGRIVWRDSGAESGTLSRLDRIIATKADPGVLRR